MHISTHNRSRSNANTWAFAVVAFPMQALYMAVAVYLPQYYASTLGMELAYIGMVFALVRIIDLPVDPLLGLFIDKTNTRKNNYRIWLIAGAPITMAAVYMLFMAKADDTLTSIAFWLLLMYLGSSMITLAHSAWAANISTSYQERSSIFAAIGTSGVAGMTLLFAMPLLVENPDGSSMAVPAMGWFILVSTPIAVALAMFWSPTPKLYEALVTPVKLSSYWGLLRHKNMGRIFIAMLLFTTGTAWEGSLFIFYFSDGRGLSVADASTLLIFALGAGLFGAPAAARLASVVSKHAAVMIFAIAYAAALASLSLVPVSDKLLSSAPVIITGFLYAGFHVLLRSMTADVIDEIRLAEGRDKSAMLYALLTLAPKIAAASAIGLTFWILSMIGYQAEPGAANSSATIADLQIAYLLGPIAFILIGAACIIGYDLGPKRTAKIRQELDSNNLRG
jgi:GPH family glycoside/pentoside/hexuronide:cation symporter